MVHLAATATPLASTHSNDLPGLGVVVLVGLVWAVGYLLLCWVRPFATCRHSGKRPRHCRRCSGTGHRIRPGRHVINHLRAMHRAGTRHRDA